MAAFTINIPIRISDADDVKNAFASSYGYSEQIESGGVTVANPLSKEDFVKQKCINFILDIVKTELIKNEEVIAKEIAEQIAGERANEVTQWFDERRLNAIGGSEVYQQFPQVSSILLETFENEPISFTLTASDPNNLPVTFYFTSDASFGNISGNSPDFTYDPNSNYFGSDIIKFKASNGSLNSLEASVQIIIKRKLFLQNDSITTRKNQLTEISLIALNNNGNVIFSIEKNPEHGEVTISYPFIYNPHNDFIGEDSIIFKAQDDIAVSNDALITINVVDIEAISDNFNVNYNESFSLNLVAQNAADNLSFNIITNPLHGTLAFDTIDNSLITYSPNDGYVGDDSFTYQAVDDLGQSNIAEINFNILPMN